jgi:hypothetical protein
MVGGEKRGIQYKIRLGTLLVLAQFSNFSGTKVMKRAKI